MKLRNKKTDAIVELVRIEITDDRWIRLDCRQRNGVEHCMFYRSLVELNDEWDGLHPTKTTHQGQEASQSSKNIG